MLSCHRYGGTAVTPGRYDILLCNTHAKRGRLPLWCFPVGKSMEHVRVYRTHRRVGSAHPMLSSVGHSLTIHGAGGWMQALSGCRVTPYLIERVM